MTKNEMARALADATNLTIVAASEAVDVLFNPQTGVIASELAAGREVNVAGFGKFTVRERAARMGKNPSTGEPLQIAAAKVPGFKPGKTLRGRLG